MQAGCTQVLECSSKFVRLSECVLALLLACASFCLCLSVCVCVSVQVWVNLFDYLRVSMCDMRECVGPGDCVCMCFSFRFCSTCGCVCVFMFVPMLVIA